MRVSLEFGRLFGLAGAVAYISLFGLTYGMSFPLFALLLEAKDTSGVLIGASTMSSAIGGAAITPLMPRLLARVGLAQMLAIASVVVAFLVFLAGLSDDPWAWMAIRPFIGAATSVAFFGAEHWVVALAPDGFRGRTVAVYSGCIAAAFGAGSLLLGVIGIRGWLPFLVVIALLVIAVLPALAARRFAPRFAGSVRFRDVPSFFMAFPVICLAVLTFAIVDVGILGLLPAWGVRSGLGVAEAAALAGMIGIGGVLAQFGIGFAADRFPTRRLMVICAVIGSAALMAVPSLIDPKWALWAMVLVGGGAFTSLYTLALIELGNCCEGRQLAIGNAALILFYSLGAIGGPVYAGGLMDAIPPDGLLYAMGAAGSIFLALAWFAEWRRHGLKSDGS